MTNDQLQALLDLDRNQLPEDGGPEFNRLIFSRSPYLLQHSRNPVNWREWGEEAQEEARQRNLPLFVSIGYATCHWCHVMAHESFEDEEVADILNHAFIPVKIDREERPDLDEFCMAACQALTGGGGWPLNCFLKPDGTPFYALTYLPKEPRRNMPGFLELLENIATVWKHKPDAVDRNANSLMDALTRQVTSAADVHPPAPVQLADHAAKTLQRIYDSQHHGFGSAPKFPMPPYLFFLLQRSNKAELQLALNSLMAMRHGGIWDQLGGGIHRYSTDRSWLVPHFEKMLYDQALVGYASVAAYSVTTDDRYLEISSNLFEFVLRELTSVEGGFYCGLDADADGREGACHVWRKVEIEQVLGDDAESFCNWYGVTGQGNFENTDEHVLFQARPDQQPPANLYELKQKLLTVRNQRPQPLRDVKILAGWNGLMIAALAHGAAISGNQAWLAAASRAADFILDNLTRPDGRMLRSWCNGSPSNIPAFLEDYSFLGWGLLELYRAGGNSEHLKQAEQLCHDALSLFSLPDGRLSTAGSDQQRLPVDLTDHHDGVIPSGSSALAMNLAILADITGSKTWYDKASQLHQTLLTHVQAPINHLWLVLSALKHDNRQ